MEILIRGEEVFFGLLLIGWNIGNAAVTDQTVCSEYLVSGLYGVEDSALTASGSHGDYVVGNTFGPQNARLHFDGHFEDRYGVSSSWSSDMTDKYKYIQVQFPRVTTVDAIFLQGRKDIGCSQWVETYYVQYSMDGLTRTNVTSLGQHPILFTGKSDRDTVVKSSIVPSITVVYLRINPRSWSEHPSLRFDVSGCYQVQETNRQSDFYKLPIRTSTDLDQFILESQTHSVQSCAKQCHGRATCRYFMYNNHQRMCRGITHTSTGQDATFSTDSLHWLYKKQDLLSLLGFNPIPSSTKLYKVVERHKNQLNAAKLCSKLHSKLIRIELKSDMLNLQTIIAGNTILINDYRFYVSGRYVPSQSQWQYSDGPEVINSALWSSRNPASSYGNCVMLTQRGLATVNCTNSIFSICGVW